MMGAGIIVNSVFLTKTTQLFGAFTYLMVGFFMLPLINSIAQLIKLFPSGGFYAYIRPISPFLAFVTCWSYFFGKLASASLIIFVSATFIKQLFPVALASVTTLSLTLIILTIFVYLNLFNLKTGGRLQQLFFLAKSLPILLVVVFGILTFQSASIELTEFDFLKLAGTLPFVLYSCSGFEAACAMSRNIQDPEKNAPKAIFYSFFFIIMIYALFQFFVAFLLLPNITNVHDYKDAFPHMVSLMPISLALKTKLASFINFIIGFSTLGGAYGIIFSNSWNLYTLAENRHTFYPNLILYKNRHHIPVFAVIIQGIICALFIMISKGTAIVLQQTASLGTIIAYMMSSIVLIRYQQGFWLLSYLSLVTCCGLIFSWIVSTINYGIISLLLFVFMTVFGLIMYKTTKNQSR